MKNSMVCLGKKMLLVICMAAFSLALSGCDLIEKYERTVHLSQGFGDCTEFEANTHNGSIRLMGNDAQVCDVTAKITGRGPTVKAARQAAESIKITLEQTNDKLTACASIPALLEQKYYSIDYTIQLPSSAGLDFETHNGSITVENFFSPIRLFTHNGGIECDQVSGRIHAQTHNGDIRIHYDDKKLGPVDTRITTHNGSIDVEAPSTLSSQVDISTHNGSINITRPVTVSGMINKNNVKGSIGTGAGRLYLRTHNGDVTLN